MKKFFRISAVVAMLSMMATTATVTSCSDDDDDEKTEVTDTTFTVVMGGTASSAGSFLSVKNAEVYITNQLQKYAADVEIVFNGTTFISADKSVNADVSENGNSAVIKEVDGKSWEFTTSTGYRGSLTLSEEPGDAEKEYSVTVIRRND